MTEFVVRSALTNPVMTFTYPCEDDDGDDREFDEVLEELTEAINANPKGGWTVTFRGLDSDFTWLHDRVRAANNEFPIPELIGLLKYAEDEGWEDRQCVAALYKVISGDTEWMSITDFVDAGGASWLVSYAGDYDKAIEALGRDVNDNHRDNGEEIVSPVGEQYFDFLAYGKDVVCGVYTFHDGDTYAIHEF